MDRGGRGGTEWKEGEGPELEEGGVRRLCVEEVKCVTASAFSSQRQFLFSWSTSGGFSPRFSPLRLGGERSGGGISSSPTMFPRCHSMKQELSI